MKQIFFSFLFLSQLFLFKAQANETILTIDDKAISKEEFLRIYNKNKTSNFAENEKSIEEYLDLFINYKLKVLEAKELKFDTIASFQKELKGYIDKLAAPYLIDETVDEKLIQEAYERMKYDIRSKHILIKVFPNAAPKDTAEAYLKAMNIRNRLLKGEDFATVAKATSDDPSAKENGGDIGFVTSFGTLYDYENALYSLKEGELSMPVRSSAGYHIIKVAERRKSKGEVKVAHIMINVSPQDKEKVEQTKETLDSIYNKIKAGEDFGKLAKQYSTDHRTAANGGELVWFDNSWRIPSEFKDAAFSIGKKGDFTQPFLSPFGWHIVKLIDKRDVRPFDEVKDIIKSRISKDPARANMSKQVVLDKLKQNYSFQINEGALSDFINKVDSTILLGKWKEPELNTQSTLCTFDKEKISEAEFGLWLKQKQSRQKRIADKAIYVRMMFQNYINETLINYEMTQLPKKNKEFRDLSEEYNDGMLLFEITDAKVWSKSTKDTIGLEKYYEANKNNYMWDDRVEVTFFTCKNKETFDKTNTLLEKREKKFISNDDILNKINKKEADNLKIETKIYSKGDNEQIDSYEWSKGKRYTADDKIIIEISDLIAPTPKDLKDCRGLVASDYQKVLEEEWLKSLREKYKIEINQNVVNSIKQ